MCETVVGFIKWEVNNVNSTVEFIENAVKAMCQLYPIEAAKEAVRSDFTHGNFFKKTDQILSRLFPILGNVTAF